MTIAAIRAGLAAALADTGIERIYPEIPDSLEPPAVVVGNPTGEYDESFDRGAAYVFPVAVITGREQDSARAVRTIDPYVEPDLATSVPGAVNRDQTLGGACMSARVRRFDGYNGSDYSWSGVDYAGVTFEVEVWV